MSTVDSPAMSLDEAKGALESVREAMHEQFSDHSARLAQLDASLATAAMVVDHIYDEDVRHKHDPVRHAKAMGTYVRED